MLSSVTHKLAERLDMNTSMILPHYIFAALDKIVGREQCVMSIMGGVHSATPALGLQFDVEGYSVKTKLIDGTYPGWRRVIPTSFSKEATIPVADFLSVVRVALAARSSREKYRPAKLQFDGSTLSIKVSDHDTGDLSTAVDCVGAEGFEVGFNPAYLGLLGNAVKRTGSKGLKLLFQDAGSPTKLVGDDDAFGFHILMPTRI